MCKAHPVAIKKTGNVITKTGLKKHKRPADQDVCRNRIRFSSDKDSWHSLLYIQNYCEKYL
jgi:hypothetical protein